MRHLPVCDNSGEVVGMLTRKNLMHYLLTDQKEKELMKIRRVQRGARNYLKYRKKKANKLYLQFSLLKKNQMTYEGEYFKRKRAVHRVYGKHCSCHFYLSSLHPICFIVIFTISPILKHPNKSFLTQ